MREPLGLPHDPIPWLMAQEGTAALRARGALGLTREQDVEDIAALTRRLAAEQDADGSYANSVMRTAGVLNLLADVSAEGAGAISTRVAGFLMGVLQSQPGSGRAASVLPGSLTTPCDLGGYFGPYADRALAEALAEGAREMNAYREFAPLLGPRRPVRAERRSSLDRAGPPSCYAWGLVPLCYTIEALCRAGYSRDERLLPALNALLGAQRASGGWCRNLEGHPNCTMHAVRALGAHPDLRRSTYAERALRFMSSPSDRARPALERWWRGTNLFAGLSALSTFDLPVARDIIERMLAVAIPQQRRNGAFGGPYPVERVRAVLEALRALEWG